MSANAKFSQIALDFFLRSCATLSMLPKSASEVNFSKEIQGKTGWSKYEGIKFFKGIDEKTCHLAAKARLTYANFQIKKENYEKRLVFGEHGITGRDWMERPVKPFKIFSKPYPLNRYNTLTTGYLSLADEKLREKGASLFRSKSVAKRLAIVWAKI